MKRKPARTVSQDLLFSAGQEAVLDALGDRTRRQILTRLKQGPLAVVEIARDLPVSRPAVSQHLKVLKECGLVMDRSVANRRLYSIDPQGLASLRTLLERDWRTALDRFVDLAER